MKYSLTVSLALALAVMAGAQTAQANCEELLDNNHYRCQVQSDQGDAFEDCFIFSSPGNVSSQFDLFPVVLDKTLGCGCKAKGNDKFHEADAFLCVGPDEEEGQQVVFEGAVTGKGEKIKKGQTIVSNGDSFTFECELDPSCGPP
jgi:hypothetical protein